MLLFQLLFSELYIIYTRQKNVGTPVSGVLTQSSVQMGKTDAVEAVNDIKGVSEKAYLKEGTLTVSYAEKVSDDIIISRIEKAGYTIKR